jgi:hypothetical protein
MLNSQRLSGQMRIAGAQLTAPGFFFASEEDIFHFPFGLWKMENLLTHFSPLPFLITHRFAFPSFLVLIRV